jgi:outer membrane protein assembly factor BamE (lipoprotein component of BamABCDE complex)
MLVYMMKLKILSLVLISFLAIGCANKGSTVLKKLSEDDVNRAVVVGKTTRNEVRAMFGSPLETTFTDGGLEIWKYTFEDVTSFNAANVASQALTLGLAGSRVTGTQKELIILYNDNYTVKRFNMSSSPVQRGRGLL